MFWRNSSFWQIGLVCKASSVVSHQTRWHNKRILIKDYSVSRDFPWIENHKLNLQLHLLCDSSTFLFGLLQFALGLVKKYFESFFILCYFQFVYFHLYAFFPSFTFHSYTSFTFNSFLYFLFVCFSFAYFSLVYFSFVYSSLVHFSFTYFYISFIQFWKIVE